MRSPQHSALIPFADFINHGPSSTGFFFVDQKEEEEDTEINYMDLDEMYTDEILMHLSCKDLYEINFSAYEQVDESIFEVAKQVLREAYVCDEQLKKKKKPKAEFEDDHNADFVIATGPKETYQPGSQIFIEYGNYSNTSLLIHYGFTLMNNRFEFYRLKLDILRLLKFNQQKHLPFKYDPSSKIVFYLVKNELSTDLLRVIRALA